MRLDAPWFLVAAPAVGILVAVLAAAARRARVRAAGRWADDLGRVARRHNRLSWLALGVAGAAATTALAGPRWGRQVVESTTPALDLVVAVDLSRSMLAEDVAPSRLGRAQAEMRRLLHDLAGDRVGLIGFAGRSFILAPLTADESALHLLVDALSPDLVSAGGTDLGAALRQGRDLLLASDRVADRVLVVFTDGEGHDTLAATIDAADRLRRDGIRLVLVAEGGTRPARIPLRAASGDVEGYQQDVDGSIVETARRDDVLTALADAGEGVLVAAALEDQAGAVRDLVLGFKRAPVRTAATRNDLPRGWVPVLVAVTILGFHALTRRTAALAALVLGVTGSAAAQGPRNRADDAWRAGRMNDAARLYLAQAREGRGGDTAWLNAGTALLAVAPTAEEARDVLRRAAGSLDVEVRFRALYNLGLLSLRLAGTDSVNRDAHLADARARYREALLLKPGDADAKWNLELAVRASSPQGGGPAPRGSAAPRGGGSQGEARTPPALTRDQAEQLLESIAAEERRTRQAITRRAGQLRETRRTRDW
jgi:Ca-activated chloride channel family protein